MAGRSAFTWSGDTLSTNIRGLNKKILRLVVATIEYHATRGQAYMQKTAPWKDQTTNARGSLHTVTQHEATGSKIIFAHGMPYGIWLEVRWAGKYAVIMPSVLHTGREVMGTLNKGMSRLQ